MHAVQYHALGATRAGFGRLRLRRCLARPGLIRLGILLVSLRSLLLLRLLEQVPNILAALLRRDATAARRLVQLRQPFFRLQILAVELRRLLLQLLRSLGRGRRLQPQLLVLLLQLRQRLLRPLLRRPQTGQRFLGGGRLARERVALLVVLQLHALEDLLVGRLVGGELEQQLLARLRPLRARQRVQAHQRPEHLARRAAGRTARQRVCAHAPPAPFGRRDGAALRGLVKGGGPRPGQLIHGGDAVQRVEPQRGGARPRQPERRVLFAHARAGAPRSGRARRGQLEGERAPDELLAGGHAAPVPIIRGPAQRLQLLQRHRRRAGSGDDHKLADWALLFAALSVSVVPNLRGAGCGGGAGRRWRPFTGVRFSLSCGASCGILR